ncbi:MAG: hypothetical protein RLZZ387_5382 [Chloroflexota bacterium]|jgi:Flp pilus assembly protein TadG
MRQTILRTHRASGQAVVFVGLALVVLVALSGLAVDGSNAFNQRRNAVNGADAAAFAGTRTLLENRKAGTGDSADVYAAVQQYLDEHNLNEGVGLQWSAYYVNKQATRLGSGAQVQNSGSAVPNDAVGVEVELSYTFETFFMRVLGRADLTVDAISTAIYGPVAAITGEDLIPLTVAQHAAEGSVNEDEICIFGEEPPLDPLTGLPQEDACAQHASGAFKVQPGSFGQVSFDPDGSNMTGSNINPVCNYSSAQDSMRYWWCNGSQYEIGIGDELPATPGMVSSQLDDEIEWRRLNRPEGVVPVYGQVQGSGNNTEYKIVGFMAVRLVSEQVTGNNHERYVIAERIDYMTTPGSLSWGSVDGGVYAINLVK